MKKVSFVIPCYRSAKTLPMVIAEIQKAMKEQSSQYPFEIILVNDSSPDNTYDVICSLAENNDNIIGLDLAKNFGQHGALMAGYHSATGDVIVSLDDDGQTPADEVGKLLEKMEQGYDVVYAAYAQKQHSGFRNWGSRVNSLMTEIMLDKPKELYITSYFAMRSYVKDEMLRYNQCFPYVEGLVLRTTKHICNVEVKHRAREEGKSGYTLSKLLGLWLNGFTSFSVKPLRIATIFGVVTAGGGFLYLLYILWAYFQNRTTIMGWSSTMAVMLILGGAILLVLGLIGEYVGRIFMCTNAAPQFVVRQMVASKEMLQECCEKKVCFHPGQNVHNESVF